MICTTMKIVINQCYGGFGLSSLAKQEYAKLKGFKLFFYEQIKYKHLDGIKEYIRVKDVDNEMFVMNLKKDLGAVVNKLPSDNDIYFSDYEIDRTDKDLIKVVEKLGKQANNQCADLKIVEIPDNINYEIEEYDGNEWIAEHHNTWS